MCVISRLSNSGGGGGGGRMIPSPVIGRDPKIGRSDIVVEP